MRAIGRRTNAIKSIRDHTAVLACVGDQQRRGESDAWAGGRASYLPRRCLLHFHHAVVGLEAVCSLYSIRREA